MSYLAKLKTLSSDADRADKSTSVGFVGSPVAPFREGVPTEWLEGVARLRGMPVPEGFLEKDWRALVEDAAALLKVWGAKAYALGWTATDLFGCYAPMPNRRFDHMGIVHLLRGRSVKAMGPETAVISTASGEATFDRRTMAGGSVPLWEAQTEYPALTGEPDMTDSDVESDR